VSCSRRIATWRLSSSPELRSPKLKNICDPKKALAFLNALAGLVDLIGSETYGEFEPIARERLGQRDPDDWPILAAALAIACAA
jgi:predicted nucleic acid-binding protein